MYKKYIIFFLPHPTTDFQYFTPKKMDRKLAIEVLDRASIVPDIRCVLHYEIAQTGTEYANNRIFDQTLQNSKQMK